MKTKRTPRLDVRLLRLFGILAVFSVIIFSPGTVLAQCGAPACTGIPGSGKNCTVMANLSCGSAMLVFSSVYVTASNNANCFTAGPQTGSASHTAGQAATASCGFNFSASCSVMMPTRPTSPTMSTTMTYPLFTTCSITSAADGLPVELMEYSVID